MINDIDLHQLYCDLIDIVNDAYRMAKAQNTGDIVHKELNDIATFTDKFIEDKVSQEIKKRFPDHRIIGEENGTKGKKCDYEWLIDPIDGTVNFAAGIEMFGTSIALRKNKETILGIIFDWPNDRIYHAIKGEGAYCGEKKLQVSSCDKLSDSIVTICLTSNYSTRHSNKVLSVIKKLQPHVRGIRIIVCTVYELIWIATGKSQCMINIKPSLGLSSAAGKLIIAESGGKITNTKGAPRKEIDDLLISNGVLHDEIVSIINQK